MKEKLHVYLGFNKDCYIDICMVMLAGGGTLGAVRDNIELPGQGGSLELAMRGRKKKVGINEN